MALRAVTSNGVAITPSSVSLPTGGTFDLYNTADQTTNYERLRVNWSSGLARIFTQFGGSASARALVVGISGTSGWAHPDLAYLQINSTTASPFALIASSSSNSAAVGFDLISQTYTASSGTQIAARISPTFNQSGTAGYTALDINPTESATGSGTKLLQRWAVGGSTQAQMNAAGTLWLSYVAAINNIGFTNSIGSANDVTLTRDAADTLALRRDTNAQTFRVYNTYTDGSNGEWFATSAGTAVGGNGFRIGTYANGTGATRNLGFVTNGTVRFGINTSGHFLAEADNTYDIGASGANRPRNIYVAGTVLSAATRYTVIYTVATLPAAASNPYVRCMVNDSSVTAAGNYGAVVVGGGANIVPVYSDGTNWRIG